MHGADVTTKPYPGFATDLQQPLTTMMTQVEGISEVKDTIYVERFKHCLELQRMGFPVNTSVHTVEQGLTEALRLLERGGDSRE